MSELSAVARAVVTNVADPLARGRIKFRAPTVLGSLESEWADPTVRGSAAPTVGDTVFVTFADGDLSRPVWFSGTRNLRAVADSPAGGWESIDRDGCQGLVNIGASGSSRFRRFTAPTAGTSSAVTVIAGQPPSGLTITLIRHGLYLIDGAGVGTLVASTANDVELFAAGPGAITKSWSSSYSMVAGQRYAIGTLVAYTGTGSPTINFVGHVNDQNLNALAPRLTTFVVELSDLPATIPDTGTTATSYYYRLS